MNKRYLKGTAYTPVRERASEPYRSRRNSDSEVSRPVPVDLSLLFNKTILEVLVLCIFIGAIGTFLFSHEYFEVRDVRIEGLDAYGTERVRSVVTESLDGKWYGIHRDTYLFVSPTAISNRIHEKLASDTVSVVKQFPHSLIISATERPISGHVFADNGTAYIAPDGKLVRWYPEERVGGGISMPTIVVKRTLEQTELFSDVIPSEDVKKITELYSSLRTLGTYEIETIGYEDPTEESVTLTYKNGPSLLLKLEADLNVQIKKAHLSLDKYPQARTIDVRFADKVFVSF